MSTKSPEARGVGSYVFNHCDGDPIRLVEELLSGAAIAREARPGLGCFINLSWEDAQVFEDALEMCLPFLRELRQAGHLPVVEPAGVSRSDSDLGRKPDVEVGVPVWRR